MLFESVVCVLPDLSVVLNGFQPYRFRIHAFRQQNIAANVKVQDVYIVCTDNNEISQSLKGSVIVITAFRNAGGDHVVEDSDCLGSGKRGGREEAVIVTAANVTCLTEGAHVSHRPGRNAFRILIMEFLLGGIDAECAGNQYNRRLASDGFTGHSPIVFVTYHNAGGTELLNGIHIPFLIQICKAILRRGLISHDPIEDHGHFCPCQRIVRAEFSLLANDYAHRGPALNGVLGPMIGNVRKGDGGSIVGGRGRLIGEHG